MATARKSKTALKFDKPASWWGAVWREGIPLGNGLTGASVQGAAASDTVMFNHVSSVWQGNVGVLPDISDKVKDLRKLLDDGKYRQAEELYPSALISKNYRPQTAFPLPICDLKVNMPVTRLVKEYSRVLNMENGEACVAFRDGSVKFERAMFVSRANDCFVCEISKTGNGAIDAEFSFELHDKTCNKTPSGIPSKLPEAVMTKYEGYFMYFSARSDNGTEFGAVARISYYGGTQEVKSNSIRIKGANNILLMVKVFTESQREKEWKNIKAELSANKLNYDKMLKDHTAIHSKLFGSADLDLFAEDREISAEQLLHSAYIGEASPALIEKLWYYGRYLFVSSIRTEGSLQARPYGLWCGDYKAVSSAPNISGETQALYQAAFDGNLCETVLPLLSYYESMVADYKKNALRLYNCKGIFVPSVSSPNTGLLGSTDAKDVYFISGAGIASSMFYDYYLHTGDKKYLKEHAMPFMREAASFYEDFLKLGDDGFYVISPSYSPEGCPGNLYEAETNYKINIAKNSEFDFAVLRKLLFSLVSGAEVSGAFKDEIPKWQDMLTKVPPVKVSAAGFIHEYNTAEFSDNYRMGNAFQLYGMYPAGTCSDTELRKAYQNSVKKRISEGITSLKCLNLGYLANVASRTGDTESAIELINHMVKTCMSENLMTVASDWRNMGMSSGEPWAPVQIYGNTSLTSAITSLFVQSCADGISILPSASAFKSGSLEKILTRCGCEVNLDWDYRKGNLSFSVKAKKACTINIKLPDGVKRIAKGAVLQFDENFTIKNVEIAGGKSVNFDIKV